MRINVFSNQKKNNNSKTECVHDFGAYVCFLKTNNNNENIIKKGKKNRKLKIVLKANTH